MRLRPVLAAAVLGLGAFALPRAQADAPPASPPGKAYGADEVAALVEGLGYDARPLERGGRGFLVARPGYTIEINVVLSPDGSKLNVFAPLRAWKDTAAVPEEALLGLLRATAEYGPTRAYVLPAADGTPWVGLVRALDNRDLRPVNVREQIDFLFEHVRLTEAFWNPERWAGAARPRRPRRRPWTRGSPRFRFGRCPGGVSGVDSDQAARPRPAPTPRAMPEGGRFRAIVGPAPAVSCRAVPPPRRLRRVRPGFARARPERGLPWPSILASSSARTRSST